MFDEYRRAEAFDEWASDYAILHAATGLFSFYRTA